MTHEDNAIQIVSEIQIIPIKPQNGLIAFASFIFDDCFYLGSIGIFTRPEGGYRLTYPTKKINDRNINIFHPINKESAEAIEKAVVNKFEELTNRNNKYKPSLGNI